MLNLLTGRETNKQYFTIFVLNFIIKIINLLSLLFTFIDQEDKTNLIGQQLVLDDKTFQSNIHLDQHNWHLFCVIITEAYHLQTVVNYSSTYGTIN